MRLPLFNQVCSSATTKNCQDRRAFGMYDWATLEKGFALQPGPARIAVRKTPPRSGLPNQLASSDRLDRA